MESRAKAKEGEDSAAAEIEMEGSSMDGSEKEAEIMYEEDSTSRHSKDLMGYLVILT